MQDQSIKACLFGASPGTGNQGVNALCWSALEGLRARGVDDLHVFGYGTRAEPLPCDAPLPGLRYTRHGYSIGRGFWRRNHLGRARLAALAGARSNEMVRAIGDADVVLDASGGDSFTDLYGEHRFRSIVAPKEIALALRRPLVLLPQTYGPFRDPSRRRLARELLGRVDLAYARDADSHAAMREILGDDFDPARHRAGVDLAFGLPALRPATLSANVVRVMRNGPGTGLAGINISGLIANDADGASRRFGLSCDYRNLMRELLTRILEGSNARVLLVPHVQAPAGHPESDLDATVAVVRSLPARVQSQAAERVAVVDQALDACELKWLIGKCDWFCGTRMHATIAALSSGVPAAALAYSSKTLGVFGTCGLGSSVVDLRQARAEQACDRLLELWGARGEAAVALERNLPRVRETAVSQLDEIVDAVRSRRGTWLRAC